MKYALQPWETLIHSTISPEHLNPGQLVELTDYSTALRDDLRVSFMENFYAQTRQKTLTYHIRFNQRVLIQLLDTLYSYQQDSPEFAGFYATISSHVNFILDFMANYFGAYFDLTARVPAAYLALSCRELQQSVTGLKAVLLSKKDIAPGPAGLLLGHFTSFCNVVTPEVTYNELGYQKTLLKAVHDLLAGTDNGDNITELLIYMNFNHPAFTAWYLQDIRTAAAAVKTIPLKLELLQRAAQQLRLQAECPGSALRPGVLSVKSILLVALEQEAGYLKTNPAPGAAYTKELVNVPFKGSEIYLLHKSFIDSGGAPHEIYKSLLEKTAGFLSNKTQKGFSAESLVKYSDKVDPAAKESVKRFLQKMIRNVESYD